MSYSDTVERVKKRIKAQVRVPTKPTEVPFDGFVGTPPGENPKTFTWRDFYPDMNPDEWQITENERGVHGAKIAGRLVGIVLFFIPSKMLAETMMRR